ncbi:flagellar filament outer layer protein FlaA [Borrelia sp. BU AG58]|uniref:flagellar filament outer layer protein FlaA n=1 Tax=Borrelia sp. BU AG58 TaxID=2887345 RepID=UPI001E63711C|nr:flagellar filament outer layer protein FlaA [Borrelia sp. BU AG58]UER67388.1 flagellar filament outer layer protein FlaA [Borrelia sp. BU AG58]
MIKILAVLLAFVNVCAFTQNTNQKDNEQGQREHILSTMEDPFDFHLRFFTERINPLFARFKNNNDATQDNKFVSAVRYITSRSDSELNLEPDKQMIIPGIVKSISLWVDGRENNTEIFAILKDSSGTFHSIPFKAEDSGSKLNFLGWKKLTAYIPKNFIQKTHKFKKETKDSELIRIKIIPEHRINYEPQYIYLSELRAIIDEQNTSTTYDDNW